MLVNRSKRYTEFVVLDNKKFVVLNNKIFIEIFQKKKYYL